MRIFRLLIAVIFPLIFAAATLTLTSCALGTQNPQTETLRLFMPEWPPQDSVRDDYPALSRWLVRIETTDSAAQSLEFFSDGSPLSLGVVKNSPAAVTVRPITLIAGEECAYFLPAGLVYPAEKESLSWSGGFLADAMQRIIQNRSTTGMSGKHIRDFLSSFNWAKAQDSIDSKIQKVMEAAQADDDEPDGQAGKSAKFYNPWLIDGQKLLENLTSGEFKASLLNNTNCIAVEGAVLGGKVLSSFIPENSFIAREKTVLIKKSVPSLFLSGEIGMIIEGSSAKNLSLKRCKMPIFIEEKATYEKTDEENISGFERGGTHADVLREKSAAASDSG